MGLPLTMMLKYVLLLPENYCNMHHIPLKQYINSKKQLLAAIEQTPVAVMEYEIRKYCTISVGECLEEALTVPLKPKQIITIEWVYYHPTNPTPVKLTIASSSIIPSPLFEAVQPMYWKPEKLNKWLMRYTKSCKNKANAV